MSSDKFTRLFDEHLSHHLVALSIRSERKGSSAAKQTTYSGTLFNLGGEIFYLTAGHILAEVQKALDDDQLEIQAVLIDTFGKRLNSVPVPFDLRSALLLYIDQDGLDFGMIPLSQYYVRLLTANGTIALGEQNWLPNPAAPLDGYLMLGLPNEFSEGDRVTPTLLPVERLDAPPEDAVKPFPRFVGKIKAYDMQDIEGMSGGPIFGFKFENNRTTRYWIVAIQSTGLPERRIIFGCPLALLRALAADAHEGQE